MKKKTAIYCRLSKDDEKSGDSVSIETQKILLRRYCKENGFSCVSTYVDDGFSGLNFNRPGFQKLLGDISRGLISTVITKDLSRLGRDYIQTGYYIDMYFKERNVRYIAVNDNVDTGQGDNDIVPFKNILNEMLSLRRVR
nr:recombinase family protein [Clostridia bacterium]